MWSEEWDKKIKDAANKSEPAFQEKSWDQMEQLLEKHLPANKKRRRMFILFFTLLATSAVVFMMLAKKQDRSLIYQPHKNRSLQQGSQAEQTSSPAPLPATVNTNRQQLATETGTAIVPPANTGVTINTPSANRQPRQASLFPNSQPVKSQQRAGKTPPTVAVTKADRKNNRTTTETSLINQPIESAAEKTGSSGVANLPATEEQADDQNNGQNLADSSSAGAVTDSAGKPEDTTDSLKLTPPSAKPGFSSRLGILISAGADINGVDPLKLGHAKVMWGLGLSYDLSKRFTLRTGFYASRKIYTAQPYDYHPPSNFWNYYPNLERIDANCMIYEIPLSVVYHGGNQQQSHWFAAAGISSLIMKSEEYGYAYKDASGQPRYYTRGLQNQNKHLFSTLQLSGGYLFRLSPRTSLLTEPYYKLPVSGIGYGKVRLYSAGIMLTAVVKPFAKK